MGAAEEALAALPAELDGWRLVTMRYLRSRTVRAPRGPWAGVIEFRARMLRA